MGKEIGKSIKGMIFSIQRYSIHDGPGIRTTVFLKGCPLRCIWCQNPESQSSRPEIFYNVDRCTGCGKCVVVCPKKAIEKVEGKVKTDRRACDGCGACTDVCPTESRSLMGREVRAEYVFNEIKKDLIFYERSGGGVTLSGGEPLMQPVFSKTVLRMCKDAGIHTALDTSGYAKWEIVRDILEYVDLVLYDFKHMNSAEHKKITGVSNEIILENAKKICRELKTQFFARIPVIPSLTASLQNMEATAKFIAKELGSFVKVFLLPYHRLGEVKYVRLEATERTFSAEPPPDDYVEQLADLFRSYGLETRVGG
jgi:pyruvate formate lyase activating enzyme